MRPPGAQAQLARVLHACAVRAQTPRDRQMATRLLALTRDALADEEQVGLASLRQLLAFFRACAAVALPSITLTPYGTLRVYWMPAAGTVVAIEFTGQPRVQVLVVVPHVGGETVTVWRDMRLAEVRHAMLVS